MTTLLMEVIKKYPNPAFVETGTNYGEATDLAIACGFENIYSIELDMGKFNGAVAKFKDNQSVHVFQGDTGYVLWEVIKDINVPITFWLDAHEYYGVQGDVLCPLLKELDQIKRHHIKNHTILIDDHRIFKQNLWGVTVAEITNRLLDINPDYKITFEPNTQTHDDVIVAST